MQHDKTLQACIDACIRCARECEHCGDLCIEEDHHNSARSCRDCAEICWLAAGFMSRNSESMDAVCKLCVEICDRCAAECERHDVEHCKQCARVCHDCADQCRKMVAATV